MKKSKLEHYKKRLLKKHKEIIENFSKNKGNSKESTRNGTEDYIDYAMNSYAKEFLLSLTEMDRKQLVLIEEALKRIQDKTFAKCQQCFKEISAKRLEAAPWARHCIRCQELEELGLLPHYSFRREEDTMGYEDFEEDSYIEEQEGEDETDLEYGRKGSRKTETKDNFIEDVDEEE